MAKFPDFNCSITLGVMYSLLFLIVIFLVGITIKEGKSEKKMVSWTLYSFSVIFGIISAVLLFLPCNNTKTESATKLDCKCPMDGRKIAIPVLTVILCLSNFVGMIIAKPNLPTSELFTPHLVNVVLLIGSIFLGFGVCSDDSINYNFLKSNKKKSISISN